MLQNALKGLQPLSTLSMKTVVDVLYEEYETFNKFFKEQNEISFQVAIENHLKKNLLLSAASYFEVLIIEALVNFFDECSNSNHIINSFLKNKALKRQYHTLFKWDEKNGYTTFFGLLGEKFKAYMNTNMKANKKLSKSIAAFMSIGDERNRLVHLNYGTYTLEKTIGEIYSLYNDASYFVNGLPDFLRLQEIPEDTDETNITDISAV